MTTWNKPSGVSTTFTPPYLVSVEGLPVGLLLCLTKERSFLSPPAVTWTDPVTNSTNWS